MSLQKLAALPESNSDSSEESEAGCGTASDTRETQMTECSPAALAERNRALSSSSTESGTYIADTPSAVYHASHSALMARHANRDR